MGYHEQLCCESHFHSGKHFKTAEQEGGNIFPGSLQSILDSKFQLLAKSLVLFCMMVLQLDFSETYFLEQITLLFSP